MNMPTIALATDDDRNRVFSTIMLSFANDPVTRWLMPSAHNYVTHAPVINQIFCGAAIDNQSAYKTENIEGVAMWLPPGVLPDDEQFAGLLFGVLPEEIGEDAANFFTAMAEYHPKEPCWYLAVLAVDPTCQGNGYGAALMKEALAMIDEQGMPAYLESSNPRNISLYERYGFEPMGEIQFGLSPVLTPMYRPARA
jgi:ribosomal protein S18 acetylase RimI-like enzyme